jgi:hypothetical protein
MINSPVDEVTLRAFLGSGTRRHRANHSSFGTVYMFLLFFIIVDMAKSGESTNRPSSAFLSCHLFNYTKV